MKHTGPLLLFFLLLSSIAAGCDRSQGREDASLEGIYAELDREIARSGDYETIRDGRILRLRKELETTRDESRRTELLLRLAEEYNAYNADSALHYVSLNLNRDEVRENPKMTRRLLLKRADIMAHAGMFPDAQAVLAGINPTEVEEELKEEYYSTYCALYQYLSEYNSEHETAEDYERLRAIYSDSLNTVVRPESFNQMVYVMTEAARNGDPATAIRVLSKHIDEYPSGSREYSILASTLAYIYKTSGHPEEYKRYLALSAISDVKGAVKENMSFREVATVMFEEGDIERANRYLKKSIADANFYAGMMRNVQSSKMLPVIDDAFAAKQAELTGRLRRMVWLSMGLAIVLALTVALILKQFRSLKKANGRVRRANEELSRMSGELKVANDDLTARNSELRTLSDELGELNGKLERRNAVLNEYNRTKEQYAGLFMENCSAAIASLLKYQKSLRVLAVKSSKDAILKKLESSDMAESLLKEFYSNFDEAILGIYPDFVEKFNGLLNPGEKVVLKNGELLNTELRLYSLIRLGIDDSGKIAEFLRCSISTVYTYRSKVKKRARRPETFEDDVRGLCRPTADS